MNKQKLFKILSILGVIFVVWGIINYVHTLKNQGEVIDQKVEIPDEFARYFDNVLTKNRYSPMPKATFMSPDDQRMNWRVFSGNYLLVNFWASWCGPCVLELPSLGDLQKHYEGKGLNVIAISVDTMRSHADLKKFLDNRSIGQFAAYFDDVQEVQKAIPMRGIPTSYLLDPKGRIIYIFEGDAQWASASGIQFFDALLNITPE